MQKKYPNMDVSNPTLRKDSVKAPDSKIKVTKEKVLDLSLVIMIDQSPNTVKMSETMGV